VKHVNTKVIITLAEDTLIVKGIEKIKNCYNQKREEIKKTEA
jgi:hypothetical protein